MNCVKRIALMVIPEYSACSVYVVQAVLLCRARRQVSGDHPI